MNIEFYIVGIVFLLHYANVLYRYAEQKKAYRRLLEVYNRLRNATPDDHDCDTVSRYCEYATRAEKDAKDSRYALLAQGKGMRRLSRRCRSLQTTNDTMRAQLKELGYMWYKGSMVKRST